MKLLSIPTACGASYHMKGKIFRACVQSVLTYGTETWAMKAENLQSLGRAEHMMVRRTVFWMFRSWLRHGRLTWFGHVECKNRDDWVSAYRNVEVTGVRRVGRGRKTWRECVKHDMDELDGAEVSASGLKIGRSPVQISPKTNFSIMIKLPVKSTGK